jgi:charged multivesicular body protein 6
MVPHHFYRQTILTKSRAILEMKVQRDKLRKYRIRITDLTDREKEIARECLRRNDKQKALLALRRKKYQESLLEKTDQQLAQLEILTNDVEFALVQRDVLFGLQEGTKVLKEIHKEMGGIEGVERLLGESADAQAYQTEVNEMLSGRMTNQDEDEVEDELEALAKEVNGVPQLPDAPTQELERETPRERRERRARERANEEQEQEEQPQRAEPMLA